MKTTFSDLPAELRNEIYTHCLLSASPIALPYAYEKRAFTEPPLLSASAWIRAEAAPIYYGCNTFEAPSPPSAHQFLRQLRAENIADLRTFRPFGLILPLSAHRRWFDVLRANINRLVLECGKGALGPETVSVPVRGGMGEEMWVSVVDIEDFEIVYAEQERLDHGAGASWQVVWKEGVGAEVLVGA